MPSLFDATPTVQYYSLSSAEKPALTFGIEIEFTVATLPEYSLDPITGKLSRTEDPEPKDHRPVFGLTKSPGSTTPDCHQLSANPGINSEPSDEEWEIYAIAQLQNVKNHIADTLNTAGISAIPQSWEYDDGPESTKEEESMRCWQVASDASIMHSNSRYDWQSIEMKSPVFIFSASALEQVQQVCQLLSSRYRVDCGRSCGLHVHIGFGSHGFEVNYLKNLMATIWTIEPQLNDLHPPCRVNNKYCHNLSRLSFLATQAGYGLSSRRKCLEALLQMDKVNDIVSALTGIVRLAYNIQDLWESPLQHPFKRTIEFRQHESSLDSHKVGHWIRLCVGLVNFADAAEPAKLHAVLRQQIDPPGKAYTVVDILHFLGLQEQAQYYRRQLAQKAKIQLRTTGLEVIEEEDE